MTRALWMLAMLATFALPLYAQTTYKCGNTYSQTPCAPDASTTRVRSDATADQAPGASGLDLCAERAKLTVDSAQPDATRITPIGTRKVEVIQYAGKPIASHRFELGVSAVMANGQYGAARQYSCWVSEDQRRILQFTSR